MMLITFIFVWISLGLWPSYQQNVNKYVDKYVNKLSGLVDILILYNFNHATIEPVELSEN